MITGADKIKEIEILAPAGSYESMAAAFNGGADAVYMGASRFGARAYADNPSADEWRRAVDYAHLHHKKLYLTLNTLLKEKELTEEIYDFLKPFYEEGLDAVIIQDLGLFSLLKEAFPDLPVHGSTQMTITGREMMEWLECQGMERIVLPRELSIEEISRVRRHTRMEVEVFVQGALCYCYSGQCLMSSIIGGRSGNRGRCAQPCRLPYQAAGDKYPSHLISPKDICMLEAIPDLAEAGVNSLKIEGRMKKPEYTAMTALLYRHYMNQYLEYGRDGFRVEPKDVEKLMDLYNRGGFSAGYLHQHNGASMISRERPNHMGLYVGKVTKRGDIRAERALLPGDVVEARRDGRKGLQWTIQKKVREGEAFRPKNENRGPKTASLSEGMKVYRMRNQSLIDTIHRDYVRSQLTEKIYGALRIVKDFPAMLILKWENISIDVQGQTVEAAKNRPMTAEQLRKPILKTGNTPFVFEELTVETDGASFISNQQLNDLRRRGLDALEKAWLQPFLRTVKAVKPSECQPDGEREESLAFHVMLDGGPETLRQGQILKDAGEVRRFYVELQEAVGEDFKTVQRLSEMGKEIYFSLPGIFREKDRELLTQYVMKAAPWADGFLARQPDGFWFLKSLLPEMNITFDNSVYVMNRRTKNCFKNWGAEGMTAPAELNYNELAKLGCRDMELVVYGRQQLMISAQCIKMTREGCTKVPEMLELTDRQHKHFYAYNECTFCYNRIYNGLPTVLLDKKKEILQLNPRALRIHFTTESDKEMKRILGICRDIYIQGKMPDKILKDFTRGHFTRGVE